MQNIIANPIGFVLGNFGLLMFVLAAIFILIHRLIMRNRISEYEIVYRWVAFFAVGVTGIYTAVIHAFYPHISAISIGWPRSPFQWEVAMADLSIGVIAILSFNASYGFRLATVIATTIFLWGDAIGHIYQMAAHQNFSPGNAGSWFWMDIILPFILILCIMKLRPMLPVKSVISA